MNRYYPKYRPVKRPAKKFVKAVLNEEPVIYPAHKYYRGRNITQLIENLRNNIEELRTAKDTLDKVLGLVEDALAEAEETLELLEEKWY